MLIPRSVFFVVVVKIPAHSSFVVVFLKNKSIVSNKIYNTNTKLGTAVPLFLFLVGNVQNCKLPHFCKWL